MATAGKKLPKVQNKFALRLMPSVRLGAERMSASEGVSLNQFFNIAIAEKVAQMEHQRWAANRKPLTDEERADAISLLRRSGTLPPEPGDEIPAEFLAWQQRHEAAEKAAAERPKKRA